MEKKKIFDERSTLIELIEYGATIRGKVISRFILLEDVINLFLTFQFSGEKEGILLESLFTTNKITFDSKRKLFISIINKHHAGFANINKGDKKSPGITTRLQLLSEERNVFAHNSLDTGKESVLLLLLLLLALLLLSFNLLLLILLLFTIIVQCLCQPLHSFL